MVNGYCITHEIASVLIRNCSLKGFAQYLLLMLWRAAHERHYNVPIREIYSPAAGYTLAFAEGLLLAKSRCQRAPSITTGIPPTSDMKLPMSAFPRFTSGVGGKAAVVRDRR
jgi:hypothetical protein